MGSVCIATLVAVVSSAEGHATRLQMEGTIEAPLSAVESVVTDVKRYPDWFPGMRTAAPASAQVYDTVFHLPWPLKTLRNRIAIVQTTAGNAVVVRWRQVDGDFVRNEGQWTLVPIDATHTAIRYEMVVQFQKWVPGWMVRRAERRSAPRMLDAVEHRAQMLAETASR